MWWTLRAALLASAAAAVAAAAATWAPTGEPAPAALELPLLVAVAYAPAKLAALEATFWAISDPTSPRYGQHLSQAAADELLTPADGTTAAVLAHLAATPGVRGLTVSPRGDYIRGFASVAALERLVGCVFERFAVNTSSGRELESHRCRGAASGEVRGTDSRAGLPADVARHVSFVHPSHFLAAPTGLGVRAMRESRAPDAGETPATLRALYGLGTIESTTPSNKQTVGGFLGEYASPTDLAAFYSKFYTPAIGRTLTIVGPNKPANPGVEASLDVEYITAIGGGVNTTFLYVDGGYNHGDNEPYTDFVAQLLALPDGQLPYVVSMSYSDNENTVPSDFSTRSDAGFMALGARGVSVFGSSGDGGVSGSQGGACPGGVFVPTWPASSIYITAVGATEGRNPETAVDFSSGGFSNTYARPAYQQAAVAAYLASAPGLPPAKVFNQTGAGIPDVAALGVNFNIINGGSTFEVDGTSCSCPTFAGLVSLLNDLRLQKGKATLGYLNTLLYANAGVFTDILTGNNPGCQSNGFQATSGWDPVTGLGTPVYAKMAALVSALP